jgi:thymidylate synthase (FAD)
MIVMNDPLGDDVSRVELINYMGSDESVVDAARVSMNKGSHLYTEEQNDKLITYLAKHQHWTPFSHPQITLRIKMPIFVARQWFKHMVGFTRNEVSRRYVDGSPEFYNCWQWREKAENVKQGSKQNYVETNEEATRDCQSAYHTAFNTYHKLLQQGVCAEQARMVLPQGTYTEFIETGSLAAYSRLCKLRLDSHAQKETQMYAHAVANLIEPLFPVSWKALMKGIH